jgi:hypothetical protein
MRKKAGVMIKMVSFRNCTFSFELRRREYLNCTACVTNIEADRSS